MKHRILSKIRTGLLPFFLLPLGVTAAERSPLEGIDGNMHNLDDYIGRGKWVVVNIWGTACPPCREEMPELVRFHDQHYQKDAMVLGIAIDFPSYGYANKAEVAAFADDYLVDFPILLSSSTITEQLDTEPLQGLPTTYLYDPSGRLMGVHVGSLRQQDLESAITRFKLKPPASFK